jgi:hypothetical protein
MTALGLALATFGVLGGLGCKSRPELVVSDTEGRSFSVVCSGGEDCRLSQKTGPRANGAPGVRLRARGRFVGVCPDSESVHVGDCRALTCAADSDCPPSSAAKTGTCVGSLCVEPSHELDSEDAVLLCLAGSGLGHERSDQVTRYALALNCGTPCRVPTPCRQP